MDNIHEPMSLPQRNLLLALGCQEEDIKDYDKEKACALIKILKDLPTPGQVDYLRLLGVPIDEIQKMDKCLAAERIAEEKALRAEIKILRRT